MQCSEQNPPKPKELFKDVSTEDTVRTKFKELVESWVELDSYKWHLSVFVTSVFFFFFPPLKKHI